MSESEIATAITMVKFVTVSVLILAIYIAYYLFQSDHFEPGSIRGKRVLVTGASSGIGEQVAYKYAKFGAKLVISARRAQQLEKVAEKCRQLGASVVEAVSGDMTIPADRERLARKTEEILGGLDILILNHGNAIYRWTEANPEEVTLVHDMFNTGLFSYVHLITLFRQSLEQNHGYIGVTASVFGKFAVAGMTHYNSLKFAQFGYFSALRQELRFRKSNISLTLAVFASIETDHIKSMLKKHFPNAGLESRLNNVQDAVDAYIRGVSTRAYEVVYPRRAQVLLFINGIIPKWFEDVTNWHNERLRNQ